MSKLSDRDMVSAYIAAGCSMTGAAKNLGCSTSRIGRALRRRSIAVHTEREEREFQTRKFKLLAELSRLEIVR
ncbi:hypothetical protein [Bradyrhizobium sp.]|uniref:hypothetical protein n=1 Tax=Bradyrhizobium sp. TaxID=376 RepID=UPI0007C8AD13|nr:hypothetical protein [Bradyrhizobium sp.]